MNFNMFNNGRQLQDFIAFLNHCEGEGVTDIRFVRQRAEDYLTKERKLFKLSPEGREQLLELKRLRNISQEFVIEMGDMTRIAEDVVCPACQRNSFVLTRREDVAYRVCAIRTKRGTWVVGCGYSELVGDV